MSKQHESTDKASSPPPTPLSSPPPKRFRYQQIQVKSVEHLYLKSKFADVNFQFISNDGVSVTRVPAHKNILAIESDVFERMFYGQLKESDNVTILDVSDAAFREFLQFFYLADVNLTAENIAGVMYLGHKYNFKDCVDACVQLLKENLTDDNVCTVLSLANFDELGDLLKICEKRILLNTATVFESAGFLECDEKALEHILKMDALPCPEIDVYEACMAWVRARSQQDALTMELIEMHLGKLYYEIRFVSMSIQDLCTLKAKYNAVLSTDFEAIIRLIARVDLNSDRFNMAPRHAKWNTDANIICDRKYYNTMARRYALNTEEKITFSTNEPIVFGK